MYEYLIWHTWFNIGMCTYYCYGFREDKPTPEEKEDMAQSIIDVFPVLKDTDSKCQYVSIVELCLLRLIRSIIGHLVVH